MKVSRDGEVTDEHGRRIGRVRKLSHVLLQGRDRIRLSLPPAAPVDVDHVATGRPGEDAVHVAEHSPGPPVEPTP